MITIFASVAEGPERNYSRIGNIYQMILNPANISYIIVTEHIIAMNNGTFLSVAAHNNDTWIEHVFKSPRMKSFAPYSTKDDLITLEARIMGAYVMSDVGNARYPLIDDARRVLAEFFLTNPSASIEDAPKLTVSCSIS
jgi:hypothetical protein